MCVCVWGGVYCNTVIAFKRPTAVLLTSMRGVIVADTKIFPEDSHP